MDYYKEILFVQNNEKLWWFCSYLVIMKVSMGTPITPLHATILILNSFIDYIKKKLYCVYDKCWQKWEEKWQSLALNIL